MADDIVERLRDYSARGAVFATNDMCWEAADEIERLRAAGDALVAFATHERGCFLPGLEQCWCGKSVAAARWQEARQ